MSGACALAADERLAAYDFGPGHPFQAGRLEAGLCCCGRPGCWRRPTCWGSPAADADLELVHDRDYLEALARFSPPGRRRRTRGRRPGSGWSATTGRSRAWTRRPGWSRGRPWPPWTRSRPATWPTCSRPWPACTTPSGAARSGSAWSTTSPWPSPAAPGPGRCGCSTWTWTPTTATACRPPSTTTRGCARSACTRPAGTCSRVGEVHELGRPPGVGRSVNLPLEPRTGDDGFLAAFDAVVEPLAAAFRPDVLVTQNGCDGHADDPQRPDPEPARLPGAGQAAAPARPPPLPGPLGGHRGRRLRPGPGGPQGVGPAVVGAERPPAAGQGPVRLAGLPPRAGPARRPPPGWSGGGAVGSAGTGSGAGGAQPADGPGGAAAGAAAVGAGRLPAGPPGRPGGAAGVGAAGRRVPRPRRPAGAARPQPGLAAAPAGGRPGHPRLCPRLRPGARGAGRIAEEPAGEVAVAHTPDGVVVGYVAVLDPEPGSRFASSPGAWRSARSRWPPAGAGAGWPAPCSASPSSPTRSRTAS